MSYKNLLKGKFCHRVPAVVLFWNQWSFLSSKKRKINVSKLLFYVQSSYKVALISHLPLRENASVQSKLAYAKCESDWIISEWWCAFQSFHYIKISYDFRRNGVMSSFLELDSPLTRCQLPAKHVFVFSWRDKEWRLNDDSVHFLGEVAQRTFYTVSFLHYVVDIQLAK